MAPNPWRVARSRRWSLPQTGGDGANLPLLRRPSRMRATQKWLASTEAVGEMGQQGAQCLLSAVRWNADAVRDDVRRYVLEHLGDEKSGILVVDETGFLKKVRSL
jgi:SRSO17 transposase